MKIPEVYEVAAGILKRHLERQLSLKNLIYKSNFENLKQLFALLHETVKNKPKLDFLLNTFGVQVGDHDPYVIRLVLYDVLIKNRRIPSSHPAVKLITKSKKELATLLSNYVEAEPPNILEVPRYVRINTLKMTVSDALEALRVDQWNLVNTPSIYEEFLGQVKILREDQFLVDFHLDYLLVFHPKTDFHNNELVKNGSFLLQDKASCLSAVALNPKPGSNVIDACAAPGMKTTLMASLLGNEGSILAVDRNGERSKLLQSFIELSGATCIDVCHSDFLSLNPDGFPDVKYILVDPSCSGSGIARRAGYQSEKDETRITKLANFQSTILKHAFQFRKVKKIVYSTCSLHKEENERVVEDVLRSVGGEFKIKTVLKNWTSRGREDFSFGQKCASASPEKDLTNGFFIAGFVRRKVRD